MIEEITMGEEPQQVIPPWQTHDWSTEDVQFVQVYMRTGNASRAYREMSRDHRDITAPGAWNGGTRMLGRPHIRSYVEFLHSQVRKALELTKDNVLTELARLGFGNMSDFTVLQADGTPQFDLSAISRDQAAAIQEMTIDTYVQGKAEDAREVRSVKVKLAPKTAALELLGKHLKLFTDVVESHTVTDVADEIVAARRARQERLKQKDDDDDVPAEE